MSRLNQSVRLVGLAVALFGYSTWASAQEPTTSTPPASTAGATTTAAPASAPASGGAAPTSGAPTGTAAAGTSGAATTAAPTSEGVTTGGTATAPERAATASTAGETQIDGATYQVRLRDLEQRVDELKEQIRRSHTRLSLLSDTILSGGVGGSRAEITFINEMSSAFRMTEAVFVLDGAIQYKKQDDTGVLAAQTTIPIFSGSIPAGDHTLQVLIKLRGHGYGVFSYLRGYKFEVRSDHSFTITDGKTIELKATAWEQGGATTPLEERPAIRYVENVRGIGDNAPTPPTGTPAPAPAATPAADVQGGTTTGPGSVQGGGGISVGGGK